MIYKMMAIFFFLNYKRFQKVMVKRIVCKGIYYFYEYIKQTSRQSCLFVNASVFRYTTKYIFVRFVSVYLWCLLQIIVLALLFQVCGNFKSTYQINFVKILIVQRRMY